MKLGNWNSVSVSTTNSYSFDLSSITAINDQPTVYLRVVDGSTLAIDGGAVSGYQDDRIDNFLVSAQPVPEPATIGLAALGGVCALFNLKRKRLKSG